MNPHRGTHAIITCALIATLAGCSSGPFAKRSVSENRAAAQAQRAADGETGRTQSSFWDLFRNADNPNVTVTVNKYIWQASLEVLDFLPIETVDPFTGVIATGYGVPPGGGQGYRATVLVQDPALDARSLKLSLQTRNGTVSAQTLRTVEEAILTRARQLRVAASQL